ncbi:MAG: SDR family oxidoreductase [Planctomycetota bacterium]
MKENQPVCVVTGGTSGIGRATVKLFSQQGFSICTCGRSESKLQELRSCDSISEQDFLAQVDLADIEQTKKFVQQAIESFGRIDVLVNNAAVAPLEKLEDYSAQQFEQLIDLNIRSTFYLTQLAWQQMVQQHSGTVVNISSMAAVDPFPGFSIYGASKAWSELMTTALAAEGKDHGIRVYSVRPGAVETSLLRGLFPDFPPEQCVTPDEVAQKVWDCVSGSVNSGTHIQVAR